MTIGVSFMLAMFAGPLLDRVIGVSGIFWLTALLALVGIALIALVVPTPTHSRVHRDAEPVPAMFRRVLRDPNLLRLDFGIFSLHLILTALFLAIPLVLRDLGLEPARHGLLYLPVMVGSIVLMVPFVILAERRGLAKQVFLGAVFTLAMSQLALGLSLTAFWEFVVALTLFFVAINLLEAMLPSLVSKFAPVEAKGTAMGVYSSSQFIGAFSGGLLGGWALVQMLKRYWVPDYLHNPVTLAMVVAIYLVISGWKAAVPESVYLPPAWGRHLTALLVLVGFILFFAAYKLYDIYVATGVAIAAALVQTIGRFEVEAKAAARMQHPNIVAVKEAGGSVERVSAILNACDITVLSGDDGLAFAMIAAGATGVISAGDSRLLPTILDAAERFRPMDDAEQAALLATAGDYEPLSF